MSKIKYPPLNPLLRALNFTFRHLPKQSKTHYNGILLKKDLTIELPALNREGYEFSIADLNDIQSISSHPESREYEVYEHRLLKGQICYCAKSENEIMCFIWISFKTCGIHFGAEEEIQFLPLKEKQAYSYNLYTYNKFRQKGIASKLKLFSYHDLKDKGITELFNVIGPGFTGSMKISLRDGYEPIRMVCIYRFKKFKKVFMGTNRPSNKLEQWKKWFKTEYGLDN